MLEKHEQEPQAISKPNLPTEARNSEARIEGYLDKVCVAFCQGQPDEKSSELRAEMRLHLQERVAANLELGDAPEEAVSKALQQFGASKQVGRAWQREREAVALATGASAKQSARLALTLYAPTCLLCLFLLHILDTMILGMVTGYIPRQSLPILELLGYATAFVLPVPAGLLTGLLAQRRPVRTVFWTLCFLSLPMAVFYAFQPPLNQSPMQGARAMLLGFGLLWIPIGCASAGIGGWLRKQRTRLKQRLVLG